MLAGDILGERARVCAEKAALIFAPTGEVVSYRRLNHLSSQIAQLWVDQLALSKGDRVAVLSPNSPQVVAAFFAAGKTGCVIVPLSPRQTSLELIRVVADARPSALMFDPRFSDIAADICVGHPEIVSVPLEGRDWEHRLAQCGYGITQNIRCHPEDLYALFYTSGSTGRPKGVMIPHRMVIWNAYNTAVSWQLRDDDILSIILPLCHAGGLTVFLTPGILLGCTVLLHGGFDGTEIWRKVEEERVSLLMAVPTMLKMLTETRHFATVDVSSIRWFISGGAPLPDAVARKYAEKGLALRQGYGLSEVGVNCFVISDADAKLKPSSVGKPMLFTEARCIDGMGCDVDAGEVGELLLRGPHVCLGYWNDPDASRAAINADGWFHTGDSVRVDEDGFYYIVGRIKDMYISGGLKICPAEIEAEVLCNPQVSEAAIIGVPDEKWGEVGAAFVVAHVGASLSPNELRTFLAGRLAKYKIPKYIHLVETLPKTALGKVIRPVLSSEFAILQKKSEDLGHDHYEEARA